MADFIGIRSSTGTTQFFNIHEAPQELGFIELVHEGGTYQKGSGERTIHGTSYLRCGEIMAKEGLFKVKPKERVRNPEFYVRKT